MLRRVVGEYRAAYAGLPARVWLLSLVLMVNRCGTMVLPFLALYFTKERALSAGSAGALMAVFGVGAIAGSWLGGWATGRIGALRVQFVSLTLTAVGFALVWWARTPLGIAGSLLFLSVCGEALRPAASSATVEFCPPHLQAKGLTLNRLAVNLGMSIGPAVGGWLASIRFDLLFLVDAITCLMAAGLLLGFFGLPGPTPLQGGDGAAARQQSPWRDRRYLAFLALLFLSGLVFFQLIGAYVLYLNDHYRMGSTAIGLVFTINTLTIVAVEMMVQHYGARSSALRLVAVGCLFIALGFGMLPWGTSLAYCLASVMVWTVGEMLMSAPATTFAARRGGVAQRGAYMGLYTAALSAAHVIGVAVGLWVYEFEPTWVWHGCAVLGVASAAGFFWMDASEANTPTETAAQSVSLPAQG